VTPAKRFGLPPARRIVGVLGLLLAAVYTVDAWQTLSMGRWHKPGAAIFPIAVGLLLAIPKGGSWIDIVEITIKTTFGLMALAAVAQNWALRQNTPIERGLLLLSGLLLVFPSLIEAIVEWIIGRDISYTYVPGLIIGLGVLLWQYRTPATPRPVPTT